MPTLVLTVVLGGFMGLILMDAVRAHRYRQEQKKHQRSTHSRLMKEIRRYDD